MGASSYSDAVYSARIKHHIDTGTSYFTHDADIKSGKVDKKVHESLDPSRKNSVGKNIRESFDSPTHPESRSIAVLFDVTGSMRTVPKEFKDKLGKLMALLIKKGYIEYPQVLFGGIGDATCDTVPLQIGQFESGNEMDSTLANIFLEGGGGGQQTESYELAMYYMARHTDMDCFNKRGQKGYLFLIGDETPYSKVKKSEVERIIGDTLQEDVLIDDILTELKEKFEIIWIMPGETSHFNNDKVLTPLKKMFGQNFIKLENPSDVCELIASTIGVNEGYDLNDVIKSLKDIGADEVNVNRAAKSLATYSSKTVAKTANSSSKITPIGEDTLVRL